MKDGKKLSRTKPSELKSTIGPPSPPIRSTTSAFPSVNGQVEFHSPFGLAHSYMDADTENPLSPTSERPPMPAAPESIDPMHSPPTEDIAEIKFRSNGPGTPTRTLYAGPKSPSRCENKSTTSLTSAYYSNDVPGVAMTTVYPHQVGVAGRKASRVDIADYLPGVPGGGVGGKAMAAGFDPVVPMPAARALSYSRKPSLAPSLSDPALSGRRVSTAATRRHFAQIDSVRKALNLPTETGSGNHVYQQEGEALSQDISDGDVPIPTVYSNSFAETATESLDGPVKWGSRDDQRFVRPPKSVLRDPTTGKIDWRTRLSVHTDKDTPADDSRVDKDVLWEAPSSDSGNLSSRSPTSSNDSKEKYFNSHFKEYSRSDVSLGMKPIPHVVELPRVSYSSSGRFLLTLSPITFLLSQACAIFYLCVRCSYIINAHKATGRPFISAWIFFGFEALVALWIFCYSAWQMANLKLKGSPRYLIKGEKGLPTVDVLILSTGQDSSMVMDATVAAARFDWPLDKLRVLVIDDTASTQLQRMVETYSNERALHVTYHKRTNQNATSTSWYKSSVINFGLAETRAEGRISGEYVVVVEAESIPEPDLLRVTLGHLIQNPLVALVQSPSGYYNLPKKPGMFFGTFLRCVEPEDDSRSGWAVRRSAIDDIGGMPTKSSIEDKRLQSVLEGRGYMTHWMDEVVQYSLIPDSFSKHIRQRVDRSLAHFGTARRMRFYIFGSKVPYMSFWSRMEGLGRAFAPLLSIALAVGMAAYPTALIYGGFVVPALSIEELNLLIGAALSVVLSERLHALTYAMASGNPSAMRFMQAQIFMAPYTIVGMLRKLVPRALRRRSDSYWTSEEMRESRERDPKNRVRFLQRLQTVLFGCHSWIHLLFIMSILVAIAYSLYGSLRPFALGLRTSRQTGLLVLMTVAWPTLPWINVLLGSLIPFVYACMPPSVPSRENLLEREPITSIARPIPAAKRTRPFTEGSVTQGTVSLVLLGYAATIFALTFTVIKIA